MAGGKEKDDRFAAVRKDPRFARFPRKKMTVAIDDRFKAILDDEDFAVSSTAVTKRGAKKSKSQGKGNQEMRQFYHLEETPKDREPEHPAERSTDGQARPAHAADEDELQRRYLAMRGIASDQSSSSDDADSEAEPDADLDEAVVTIGAGPDVADDIELDPSEWGIGAAAGRPDADTTLVAMDEETARLAAVDLDWSRMRAVDIFAVLQSFVGKQGQVEDVTVYVSDYGKQEMAHEKEHGPRGLASSKDGDEGGKLDDEGRQRVRMYERSKLRWHFAIARFDSAATAGRVYTECDGHEFEESAITFDLRFVPDGESFANREVRDSASGVPAGYEPVAFKSKALQHTCPELTWDADDPDRAKALAAAAAAPAPGAAPGRRGKGKGKGKPTAEDLNEDNLRAYLATDSGGSGSSGDDGSDSDGAGIGAGDGGVEAVRARYARLAAGPQGGGKTWGKSWAEKAPGGDSSGAAADRGGRGGKHNGDVDLQVSFADGLDKLGARILQKQAAGDRGGATLFEQYMARKKDRRDAQRALGRFAHVDSGSDSDGAGEARRRPRRGGAAAVDSGSGDDAAGAGGDAGSGDDGFDDPFFQGGGEFDSGAESDGGGAASAGKAANGKKATKSMRGKVEETTKRADLELLAMDDAALLEAQPPKPAPAAEADGEAAPKRKTRKERVALKKAQKRAAKARADSDEEDGAGGDFAVDLSDPRFEAMAEPDFAIDPTDPRFARLKRADDVMKAVHKQKRNAAPGDTEARANAGEPAQKGTGVAALASSLKRKAKAQGQRQAMTQKQGKRRQVAASS